MSVYRLESAKASCAALVAYVGAAHRARRPAGSRNEATPLPQQISRFQALLAWKMTGWPCGDGGPANRP
jgi:hypothetical protein